VGIGTVGSRAVNRAIRPLNPGPSTSDPGLLTRPRPSPDDLGPESSDDSDPGPSKSDPVQSTAHSPPSPGPLRDEAEIYFSELFRGRFKRRISGSRSVNAAQRELQGTLDSR
jgi:hypothetical protein